MHRWFLFGYFRLFMCTGGIVRLKRKKFVVGGKVPGQNEDDG